MGIYRQLAKRRASRYKYILATAVLVVIIVGLVVFGIVKSASGTNTTTENRNVPSVASNTTDQATNSNQTTDTSQTTSDSTTSDNTTQAISTNTDNNNESMVMGGDTSKVGGPEVEQNILGTINGAIGAGVTFGTNDALNFNDINNGLIGFSDPNDPTKLYNINRIVKTDTGYFVQTSVCNFNIQTMDGKNIDSVSTNGEEK